MGLAVTALSWVGLVGLARTGRNAGAIIRRALDEIAVPEPAPAPAPALDEGEPGNEAAPVEAPRCRPTPP